MKLIDFREISRDIFFSARRVEDGFRKDQTPTAENEPVLGREKDCVILYLEAQSGKSKRENRENNGHLVRKTFTPNKQRKNTNITSIDVFSRKTKEKKLIGRNGTASVCHQGRRCSKVMSFPQHLAKNRETSRCLQKN